MPRVSPSVTSRSGSVRVTTKGHIEIDYARIAQTIGAAAIGHVLERVDAGLDTADKPFEPYSEGYAAWLAKGGEDTTVDLRVTGGLMASVAVRSSKVTPTGCAVVVGPGTGSSEQRRAEGGRMRKTGRRGPAHNIVGKYLQRSRPWLGISPRGMAKLRQLIERQLLKGGA